MGLVVFEKDIELYRAAKDGTLEEISVDMGICRQALSKALNGRPVTPKIALKVMDGLSVPEHQRSLIFRRAENGSNNKQKKMLHGTENDQSEERRPPDVPGVVQFLRQ